MSGLAIRRAVAADLPEVLLLERETPTAPLACPLVVVKVPA